MKSRYIHIGFPKSASTTLQADFFSKHPALHHLGWIHRKADGAIVDYIDETINKAIEIDIRCKRDLIYDKKIISQAFEKHFATADSDPAKKLVGISFEAFSYTDMNDVDVTQKAERLKNIFGADTKIIIVIREQRAIVKSFYSNCVQVGYYKSYKKFIEYLLLYRFRSVISDFMYFNLYQLYSSLYNPKNILILPFELLKQDANAFQKKLCDFLEIDYLALPFTKANEGHSGKSIQYNRLLNYFRRHNLGNPYMTEVYSYRYSPYFNHELQIEMPKAGLTSQKRLQKNIDLSQKLGKLIPFVPALDYGVIENFKESFHELFAQQNKQLSSELGLDLAQYGYLVEP